MRQREQALSKRLVHLSVLDPDIQPFGDEPILRAGRVVGQLTSAAFSHTLGHAVGLGYLRLDGRGIDEVLDEGNFEIEHARERLPVALELEPPFDPTGTRMRI